jgi:hypothetical protein
MATVMWTDWTKLGPIFVAKVGSKEWTHGGIARAFFDIASLFALLHNENDDVFDML